MNGIPPGATTPLSINRKWFYCVFFLFSIRYDKKNHCSEIIYILKERSILGMVRLNTLPLLTKNNAFK
jgi:hypothetical protein